MLASLNTMEAIATIRCESDSPDLRKIIDSRYQGSMIRLRKSLEPFIQLYTDVIYGDEEKRSYTAWKNISLYPSPTLDTNNEQPPLCRENTADPNVTDP